MAPARISLLVETNSLLLLTGNWPLQPWKGAGISARFPAGESDIGEIPCIFPVDQGYGLRDEFATDWFHRHVVRPRRDSAPESRNSPGNSRDSAGFWQGLVSASEPETAGSGPRRCRRPCFSLLPSRAVRFRCRFASAQIEAQPTAIPRGLGRRDVEELEVIRSAPARVLEGGEARLTVEMRRL